jgi:hypothetical protein
VSASSFPFLLARQHRQYVLGLAASLVRRAPRLHIYTARASDECSYEPASGRRDSSSRWCSSPFVVVEAVYYANNRFALVGWDRI